MAQGTLCANHFFFHIPRENPCKIVCCETLFEASFRWQGAYLLPNRHVSHRSRGVRLRRAGGGSTDLIHLHYTPYFGMIYLYFHFCQRFFLLIFGHFAQYQIILSQNCLLFHPIKQEISPQSAKRTPSPHGESVLSALVQRRFAAFWVQLIRECTRSCCARRFDSTATGNHSRGRR